MQALNTSTFFNYLEYEKRYSKHTLKSYTNDINQLRSYLIEVYELVEWSAVKHFHIRSWMVQLVEKGVGHRSVTRKVSCLRSLFVFLKKQSLIDINPMLKVNAPKFGKYLPDTVPSDKLERLFDNIVLDDFADYRNRLIIELFYSTGIRRSELIGIRNADIDRSNRSIKVLGKGNKERRIPLSVDLIKKIDYWQDQRDQHFEEENYERELLFVTDKGKALYPKWVYNMVKQYLSTVTTQEKVSPHVLRHSFATHLMDGGAELNAVKDLLGHANLAATQVYTHNSIEKLKNIYKSAHPKYVEKT